MATIYKVEIVSHWSNYTKEQLQKILEDAVKQKERDKGNTMTIEVTERKQFIAQVDNACEGNISEREQANDNIPLVSNPVNCVLCGEPLTSSEQLGDTNCCDLCWLSN